MPCDPEYHDPYVPIDPDAPPPTPRPRLTLDQAVAVLMGKPDCLDLEAKHLKDLHGSALRNDQLRTLLSNLIAHNFTAEDLARLHSPIADTSLISLVYGICIGQTMGNAANSATNVRAIGGQS